MAVEHGFGSVLATRNLLALGWVSMACAPVALALSYLQAQYHYAWPVCCAMLCQGLCPCIADCTSVQQQVLQTVPVLGCLSGQGGSTLWPYAVAGKVQVDELPAGCIR